MPLDACEFDIDVDLAPLLGAKSAPVLVNARWYDLMQSHPERAEEVQRAMERSFRNTMLFAQWRALTQRWNDRRQAMRAPILSRVHLDGGDHMVACDVSQSGLRCSGRPQKGVFDVEFKVPGLAFPVDARAEVVDFKDANVLPLVNLRFVSIDRPYREHLESYVQRRTRRLAA